MLKNLFGIIAIVVLLALYQQLPGGGKSAQSPAQPVAAAPVAPKVLTDQEVQDILDRGRAMDKKLADSNKPRLPNSKADFVLVTKVEYEEARQGLLLIPDSHAAAPEAKRLLASFDKRSAEGEEISRKLIEKARAENVSGRKSFASVYERELLRKGLSVTVTTEGDKGSTLRVKYALVSKALAFNMSENHKFLDQLREVGFRKLILTDGYNDAWTLTL